MWQRLRSRDNSDPNHVQRKNGEKHSVRIVVLLQFSWARAEIPPTRWSESQSQRLGKSGSQVPRTQLEHLWRTRAGLCGRLSKRCPPRIHDRMSPETTGHLPSKTSEFNWPQSHHFELSKHLRWLSLLYQRCQNATPLDKCASHL
jgi:hypothetical protein